MIDYAWTEYLTAMIEYAWTEYLTAMIEYAWTEYLTADEYNLLVQRTRKRNKIFSLFWG